MRKNIQSSITKRWLKNSLLLTIILLITVESVFLFYTRNTYYSSVRQAMQNRISIIDGRLLSKVNDNISEDEMAIVVRSIIEEFDEKNKFEIMTLNAKGQIIISSSGFVSEDTLQTKDFDQAKKNTDGIGEAVYKTSTGEKVMAITYILPNSVDDVVGIRVLTSLAMVDNTILVMIGFSLAICFLILFFSIVSGLYFIRSIVNPLNDIEKTAYSISQGDFNARIENKYDDEVGRLCHTINDMAEDLGKMEHVKNTFISSVSHELRTPLTSIKGWIETLQRVDDPKNENYKRGMDIVMCEADRLYEMVEELLDFSSIQNIGLQLRLEKLDLVAEITESILVLAQRAVREGITLKYQEPESIIVVNGDSNRIKQVVVNILDNAFKYSSRGCTVEVNVFEQDDMALVVIEDQGTGIAQDELEKVKIKFYKGKGAVRGSGIGLAVVSEILQAHGGDFNIESEKGVGTKVTLSLPLA